MIYTNNITTKSLSTCLCLCVCVSPCLVSVMNGLSFLIRPVWCCSSEWRRVTSQHKASYVCCMLLSLQNHRKFNFHDMFKKFLFFFTACVATNNTFKLSADLKPQRSLTGVEHNYQENNLDDYSHLGDVSDTQEENH